MGKIHPSLIWRERLLTVLPTTSSPTKPRHESYSLFLRTQLVKKFPMPFIRNLRFTLNRETAVGSQKSPQALSAPRKTKKCLITTKVTTTFSLSRCTPIFYGSLLRSTAVSRSMFKRSSRGCAGLSQMFRSFEANSGTIERKRGRLKKVVQQGSRASGARSAQRVREHAKSPRTQLAAFFNLP